MRGVLLPTRLVLFSQQHRVITSSRKLHHSTKIPFTTIKQKQNPLIMTDRPNPALNNQPLIHKGEDVFGRPAQAEGYAQYRPNYPDKLMQQLLQTLISKGAIDGTGKDKSLLVDIGTGSGQIMRKLATHFTECKGYDRSIKQLSQATQLPNVSYHEADASAIPLPEGSASVVTCAQAMHWFDIPKFLTSVEKLLKTDGVMVVLGYPRCEISKMPDANAALMEWYASLEDFWDCDRHLLDREFDGCDYSPLVQVEKHRVEEVHEMTPEDFAAYLRTWSSFNTWKEYHPNIKPDTADVLTQTLKEVMALEGEDKVPVDFVFFAIVLQRPEEVAAK